jgi:hypothetical protein
MHWLIILNFVVEILYASYMVFVVVAPAGGGPLGSRAMEIPFEMMTTRRLYATEFWIATGGLAIYLALTEIGPRLRAYREADARRSG